MARAPTAAYDASISEEVMGFWSSVTSGKINWFLTRLDFKAKSWIPLAGPSSGGGGYLQFLDIISKNIDKEAMMGILRVVLHGRDDNTYAKYIRVKIVGNGSVRVIDKAKVNPYSVICNDTFKGWAMSFDLDDIDYARKLEKVELCKKFISLSESAMEIAKFDFGDGIFVPTAEDLAPKGYVKADPAAL